LEDLQGLINVNGENVEVLDILFLTTIISILPSLLIIMTSFARYIIALSFLRTAMNTQQTPPNMVLIGLALCLTLLTMNPVFSRINEEAFQPYINDEIDQVEFVERASVPLKEFMLRNTTPDTLRMYCDLAKVDEPQTDEEALEVPMRVVIPSYMTCELKRAFEIGFMLFIPFMLIDIVVSSTLMSMGMIMLPPSMISMPFKLLLFISVNGWDLLFSSLVKGFN